MTTLREELARPGSFVVAAELVTSRGLFSAEGGRALQETARELAANPRMTVLSITDNPGGNAMLAPDTLGSDLLSLGQEVIIHLACKDWNRNALESRGWKLGSEGFRNVLALSGDYPITGHRGHAAPVFDIDSVGLLNLLADMNTGLSDERRPELSLGKPDFFLGCVVTNHKRHEREVMPQYFKLRKKIAAGARFVINQIGYDTRKDDELLRWLRREQLAVSVLANVYLLSRGAARAFHRGAIPGVIVTDELLEIVERQAASPDKGRAYFVDLAARHVAVARGLGFSGVYLGGHAPASTFDEILTVADTYADDDWMELARAIRYPLPGEFYFFEQDAETGLSSDAVSATYLESKRSREDGPASTGALPVQPHAAPGRVRAGRSAVFRRPCDVQRNRACATCGWQGGPCARAGRQGVAVRVQGLRRLLTARDRVRLPRVDVREEPTQRPLRRHPRRALRGL